jgi:hypothetical protein
LFDSSSLLLDTSIISTSISSQIFGSSFKKFKNHFLASIFSNFDSFLAFILTCFGSFLLKEASHKKLHFSRIANCLTSFCSIVVNFSTANCPSNIK